jgi:hypothetical protein
MRRGVDIRICVYSSIEMTKLVVGAPGDVSDSSLNSTMRRAKKLRASSSLDHSKSFLSKSLQVESSSQVQHRARERERRGWEVCVYV